MPNWVNNRLYIKNTGPEFNVLKEIFTKSEYPFQTFFPVPPALLSKQKSFELILKKSNLLNKRREYWNPKINRLIEKLNFLGFKFSKLMNLDNLDSIWAPLQAQVKHKTTLRQKIRNWLEHRSDVKNIKKFGARDWYDWSCINWGTKWDACDLNVIYSGENEFCIEFETAWNYPAGIYERLSSDFPNSDLMTLAWSIESNFKCCSTHLPGRAWEFENLGDLYVDDFKFLNSKPSDKFLNRAKHFNTEIPEWFKGLAPDNASETNSAV